MAGSPPEVSVEKASIKQVSHEKLILKGNYKTASSPDSVTWESQKESGIISFVAVLFVIVIGSVQFICHFSFKH